ncbi:MAG TPA: glucose-6-phosphate dehydrogenase, partial [Candidatus Acidoferrum sp.]|nr:glucose-6-phosphate dehydrogenase [Candidatus Acidoferrum sp.]
MEQLDRPDNLDELLSCRVAGTRKKAEPCTVVIFGASGDLTARKLIPALFHLFAANQLPSPCRIVGFARREKSHESWRDEMFAALKEFSRTKNPEQAVWDEFAKLLYYCRGDFNDPAAYENLHQMLESFADERLKTRLLFYLSTSPSQFAEVVDHLHAAKLLRKQLPGEDEGWQRIVVEKPFGHDLASAHQLNSELTRYAHEKQIFRIDHYLGKETVQNIMVFRFANSIFEQLWNRRYVDNVQITVSEKQGVGSRGGYYEEAGALRDMVQNHLLQVLSLVAMEPPVSLDGEAIRDEKVKLLNSIRSLTPNQIATNVVRAQYTQGVADGKSIPAYRQEPKVKPGSNVETFVAARFFIDNWRWSGVPFYLRTGKALELSASEV